MVTVSASVASYISVPFVSRVSGAGSLPPGPRVGSGGQADQGKEEVVDLPDHVDELLEVDGLGDERVGVQGVTPQDVLLRLGGGQHDHRNEQQVRVLFEQIGR